MTFATATWLTEPFRSVFGRPSRRPRVIRPRRVVALRLDTLESRRLLSGSTDVWNFVTAPRLHPMKVSVQVREPGTAPGLVFVGPYAVSPDPSDLVGQTGPLIMDNAGNPVWFHPVSSTNQAQATDFRVQHYRGKPVLTWWQGTLAGTVPSSLPAGTALPGARYYVYNQHYQKIRTISARHGFTADVHEFLITPRGEALFLATKVVKADLTPYGGVEDGSYVDFEVQKIHLGTGKLVYAWNVSDHIPLSASIVPAPTTANEVWDAYHLNSIAEAPDGSLLISGRNTWSVYEVDNPARRGGGEVRWQVGGKPQSLWPQFDMSDDITGPYDSSFQWQHDARYEPVSGVLPPGQLQISLFDDAGADDPYPEPFGPGRGLILNLDFHDMTASVLKTYPHDPPLFPNSQGNVESLPDGNKFIGWGSEPYYSEYTPGGAVLYDVLMPGENISYRAYRDEWVGRPLTKPSAAVLLVDGAPVVHASWNGSTRTVAWRLLAGPAPGVLSRVSTTSRTGFETALTTPILSRYYQVQALDAQGRTLATSNVVSNRAGLPPATVTGPRALGDRLFWS